MAYKYLHNIEILANKYLISFKPIIEYQSAHSSILIKAFVVPKT